MTMEQLMILKRMALNAEIEEGKTYSLPSYIRTKLIEPHINGDSSPSVPDKPQEIVSPEQEDTILKKPKPEDSFEFQFE